jgi:hypothetical protein
MEIAMARDLTKVLLVHCDAEGLKVQAADSVPFLFGEPLHY